MHQICRKYAENMPLHRLQHSKYAEYMQKICSICNKNMQKNMQSKCRICISLCMGIFCYICTPTLLVACSHTLAAETQPSAESPAQNNPSTFPIENVKLRVKQKAVVYTSISPYIACTGLGNSGKHLDFSVPFSTV